MRVGGVAGLVGLLLSASVPVTGDHGTPYRLTGTATFEPTGEVFDVIFEWSGFGTYRVTFLSPSSGDQLYAVSIPAHESVPILVFGRVEPCSWMEVVSPYEGRDLATGGDVLEVHGIQENCMDGPVTRRFMNLNGSLLGVWRLRVGMGVPFGTQYEGAALDVRADPRPRIFEANQLDAPQKGARDDIGPGNTVLVTAIQGNVAFLFYSRLGVFTGAVQVDSGETEEIAVPDGPLDGPTETFEIVARSNVALGTYQRL